MKILGIESSCDETAAAIVEDGIKVLSNEIASQVEIHARYGGVVPEVASRQHILSIIPVIRKAMEDAETGWDDIDGIAVTIGPGLAGSLLVGASFAKALAAVKGLPLVGVNHLEAHMYANWLGESETVFPLLCLIVSGGHSDLVLMRCHGDYTMLGRTRDDAAGEAFDKAARIMGLGYPGGPAIDKAAENGNPCIDLPHSWIKGTNDFSFSGIKTYLQKMSEEGSIDKDNIADLAASFQKAVVDVLVGKTIEAALQNDVRQILLSGGVAANRMLRRQIVEKSHVPVLIPKPVLCTDNAAMVASCGYFRLKSRRTSTLDVDVVPGLKLI
ncbi:MAG: tRNA (adenosine(37)-N6)-threonylcarbamoyltransferase complex transferase subunit TsaD [Dehalococcoidales bacterium]|nr:tRNA (adenosine(37)-N6)-threonylcarbamoyltransferase complex transferase subunit TsaD [Dehalococcoidales bacterium]